MRTIALPLIVTAIFIFPEIGYSQVAGLPLERIAAESQEVEVSIATYAYDGEAPFDEFGNGVNTVTDDDSASSSSVTQANAAATGSAGIGTALASAILSGVSQCFTEPGGSSAVANITCGLAGLFATAAGTNEQATAGADGLVKSRAAFQVNASSEFPLAVDGLAHITIATYDQNTFPLYFGNISVEIWPGEYGDTGENIPVARLNAVGIAGIWWITGYVPNANGSPLLVDEVVSSGSKSLEGSFLTSVGSKYTLTSSCYAHSELWGEWFVQNGQSSSGSLGMSAMATLYVSPLEP